MLHLSISRNSIASEVSPLIIEGLLTTTGEAGRPHIAPMGPVVDEQLSVWLLRPFQDSQTFKRLRADPNCVFHVVDDVLSVVHCLLGKETDLSWHCDPQGRYILDSACHWYSLRVTQWDVSQPRSEARAEVLGSGNIRPFWGWNRAKHAVLEAAILATRIHLTGREFVVQEIAKLEPVIEKTAGKRERLAWQLLIKHVED